VYSGSFFSFLVVTHTQRTRLLLSLSIFMCLIFFRGLAWQYTAETITIVVVEFIMAWMVQSEVMNGKRAAIVLALFPLSLLLVATLEFFGLD